MIRTETIDLYHSFGIDPRGAAGGQLQAWIWNTPQQISPRWRRRPVVLVIPGGGYQKVSPREAEIIVMRFLARGYAAFCLTYSVAPSRFPTALREAAMAMAYIRSHARELEVDPAMVAAVGFSAGGHLCGTLGTLFDAPEVRDIGPPELLRPDALGLCYPVAVSWGPTHEGSFFYLTDNDPALRQRLSLDRLVRGDMPPVFLWHTRTDASVPVRNSLILSQALDDAGVSFALHIHREGPHGVSLADATCYPAKGIPRISGGVGSWPEDMMDFFGELGFAITDGEEENG